MSRDELKELLDGFFEKKEKEEERFSRESSLEKSSLEKSSLEESSLEESSLEMFISCSFYLPVSVFCTLYKHMLVQGAIGVLAKIQDFIII